MNEPTFFAPPAAQYASANGPPLTIPAETLQALQALAGAMSGPGETITPSDIVNRVLADMLADKGIQKELAAIAKEAEADELERVAAIHGGAA